MYICNSFTLQCGCFFIFTLSEKRLKVIVYDGEGDSDAGEDVVFSVAVLGARGKDDEVVGVGGYDESDDDNNCDDTWRHDGDRQRWR